MSKTSARQKLETLQGWISWVSRQKGYPKKKVKKKEGFED
jgi:hypothetical protein